MKSEVEEGFLRSGTATNRRPSGRNDSFMAFIAVSGKTRTGLCELEFFAELQGGKKIKTHALYYLEPFGAFFAGGCGSPGSLPKLLSTARFLLIKVLRCCTQRKLRRGSGGVFNV